MMFRPFFWFSAVDLQTARGYRERGTSPALSSTTIAAAPMCLCHSKCAHRARTELPDLVARSDSREPVQFLARAANAGRSDSFVKTGSNVRHRDASDQCRSLLARLFMEFSPQKDPFLTEITAREGAGVHPANRQNCFAIRSKATAITWQKANDHFIAIVSARD